jgi:hypothetical protein
MDPTRLIVSDGEPIDLAVEELVEEFLLVDEGETGLSLDAPRKTQSTPTTSSWVPTATPTTSSWVPTATPGQIVTTVISYKNVSVQVYLIDGSIMFFHTPSTDLVARIETEQIGDSVRIWIRKHGCRVHLARLKHSSSRRECTNINLVTKHLELVYQSFFHITQPISFSCDPLSIYKPEELQRYWKLIKKSRAEIVTKTISSDGDWYGDFATRTGIDDLGVRQEL